MLLAGLVIGFGTAHFSQVDPTNTIRDQSQRQIDDQHRFEECIFATLYVSQADRTKITEQKLESVCRIDASRVEDVKRQLLSP